MTVVVSITASGPREALAKLISDIHHAASKLRQRGGTVSGSASATEGDFDARADLGKEPGVEGAFTVKGITPTPYAPPASEDDRDAEP